MVKSGSPKKMWKRFVERGAIASSSTWLARRMVAAIPEGENLTIVELGAGTGSFTGNILEKLGPKGVLIVVEINPKLAKHLSEKFSDSRVHVVSGDALTLTKHLKQVGIVQVDCVISGLPLGNFSSDMQDRLLTEIHNVLKMDGTYIQFQYFMASFARIRKLFKAVSINFEPRNLPPAFVMMSKKEN